MRILKNCLPLAVLTLLLTGRTVWAENLPENNFNAEKGDIYMSENHTNHPDGLWEKTKEFGSDAWEATKEGTAKAWDKTKELGSNAWDKTKELTGDAGEEVKEKSDRAWDKTKEISGEASEAIKEKSAGAWEATKDGTAKAWDKTKEVSGEAWDKTKETFSDDNSADPMYAPKNNNGSQPQARQ